MPSKNSKAVRVHLDLADLVSELNKAYTANPYGRAELSDRLNDVLNQARWNWVDHENRLITLEAQLVEVQEKLTELASKNARPPKTRTALKTTRKKAP